MVELYETKPLLASTTSIIFFAFAFGMLAQSTITKVIAHGGDTSLIHGCIRPLTSLLRIVGASTNCGVGETPVDWIQNGSGGVQTGDFLTDEVRGFVGDAFDYRYFANADFSPNGTGGSAMGGFARLSNFTNANFEGVVLHQFYPIGADFSSANLGDTVLENCNLTDADFTGANFTGSRFTQGAGNEDAVIQNTNFTNVDFTDADFSDDEENEGVTGVDLTNSTRTGVVWSNTICPDNTNSNDNGNTCEGHLVP